ncbi:MAG TPA: glycosyltransferase family 2 protein, partial [Gemmatimonadales bacterium]|nr:glycosyltransferase family 2 protein [Gemmatimonadales bacterium]
MASQGKVSVVLPVLNEEENIVVLVRDLSDLFAKLPYELEVIIVNDGSGAPTTAALQRLCQQYPQVGVLHLSRNFGHQAALSAGLDEAGGDAVIVMDSDLQHPVAVIPELIGRWENGADIVFTVRSDAPTLPPLKRMTSRLFYRVINGLSEGVITPGAADFRLMNRPAVDALREMPERTRFLRGLSAWIGFRQDFVPFVPAARRSGQSKYDFAYMLRFALDGIISMSTAPLKLALLTGTLLSGISFVYLVYVVWAYYYTNRSIIGWSSLIVAMLFLGGLQINLIGVLGLYIGK